MSCHVMCCPCVQVRGVSTEVLLASVHLKAVGFGNAGLEQLKVCHHHCEASHVPAAHTSCLCARPELCNPHRPVVSVSTERG